MVATVSGYHGSERFNLIKLISQTGANYVGEMSRSITHLVCWKFEGKKFSLAKKFKILIVSHRWFEDCAKAGKRIPEGPYISESGQEVGPLRLDGLLIANKAGPLTKEPRRVLWDLSNVDDESKEPVIDLKDEGSYRSIWTDPCLLSESVFPDISVGSNKRAVKKPSKEKQWSSIRYCYQEPPLTEKVRTEFPLKEESSSRYSTRSVRQKKDICNATRSTFSAETSRKGRRLVKKKINRDILESVLSDSEQVKSYDPYNNIKSTSNCPDGGRNKNILISSGTSDGEFYGSGGNRVDPLEEVDEIEDFNQNVSSGRLNLCTDDVSAVKEGISKDGRSYAVESLSGELKDLKDDNQIEQSARLPTSMELSCVICWTDFSSTRGILPCGHRFCYSCIQDWADHMAERRKISTCPLCKASFMSITKVDDAATSDQKIYSQTIPYVPTTDIFILPDQEISRLGAQFTVAPVCSECQCREPEDLLISCHLCQIRRIHSYCLDPPLLPWTCMHCKDLRMIYHHFR